MHKPEKAALLGKMPSDDAPGQDGPLAPVINLHGGPAVEGSEAATAFGSEVHVYPSYDGIVERRLRDNQVWARNAGQAIMEQGYGGMDHMGG